ncbi:hypothetical protein F5Y14DRAFT_445154 [Nemania sp. NC0429]|nr:hypothetical protein F5Y14DRAFT_445154 [Nemania sp. NC0429]
MLVPLLSFFWLHSVVAAGGPAAAADAHATRDNVGCGFHLSCSGDAFNGSVGEKGSGQARASSDVSAPSLFTWFGDAFADQQGSGCWWTPPTFTLQCDKNQPPDHGFQIGCNGTLSFGGQSVFYECPTGEGDEVNIYLRPISDQCHEITIEADSCAPSTCPGGGVSPGGAGPVPGGAGGSSSSTTLTTTPLLPPSSVPSGPLTPSPFTTGEGPTSTTRITSTSTVTTTQPPTSSSTSSSPSPSSSSRCVEMAPERIILTDRGNPDTAYGPNEEGHIQVSPNASTIFDFRLDAADLGRTCEFEFRLLNPSPNPNNPNPNNSSSLYNLTGTGIVTFAALDGWADANTTYASAPRVIETMEIAALFGGVAHAFGPFPCPGDTARAAVLLGEGPAADTCLEGTQGEGVGLVLRKC